MEELLTIAEIAKQLNIPESTIRFYRNKFEEYIPSVGEGRNKRYKPEALKVFKLIAEGLRSGQTATTVAEQLSSMFTRFVEVKNETAATAAAQQQQPINYQIMINIMDQMAGTLKKISDQQDEIINLRKQIAELKLNQYANRETIMDSQQKLNDNIEKLNDRISNTIEERDQEIIKRMHQMLDESKETSKKSLLDRLFKKK